ncbi:hypothetical protein Tco_0784076 [Tanacetum coccineum]
MATNVFGKPVTEGTRLERAATARKDPNADNKRDEAIAYVRDQKAKSGNGVSTLCIFFNATGETLYYDQEHSWYGRVWDLYPMEVQNGQWGAFLHVKNASTTSGSMAFVTYRVEANNNAAGVGPLSGKGPHVIVSADVSILPQPVFVHGGATGSALRGTHVRLWNIRSVTLVRLSSPAICCIGPGPICAYYELSLEEVHPQLPSSDATMHERPTDKVGMYTRFFDYANYRIPFSTFFVSVLTHFRIPFSQLSVFGSAKVSHFEIMCRVCNINPSVGLFWYFYTHNYKNGWFGFTKRPNVRACFFKNLDSMKNWNDHFFWVDEFVVPANARFGWFSGTKIVKDRAPTISEYNVEHPNTLIAQASPFLRFPEEFLCWVGISRNYLLNKDTYPRFEYENGEEIDLNAFIRTADPLVCPSGELSASIEREFVGDAGGSGGGDQEIASIGGHDNVEPIVPTTDNVVAKTEAPGPRRSKKTRVTLGSGSIPAASHPPKRLRADYGTTGGSAAGGKSPSVLNRLLQDSLLTVEQGVPALLTLPFITSSVTALPLEEGGDHTDSVTGAKYADPEVDSFVRSVVPVMTTTTTITAFVSSVAATTTTSIDVGKDKDVPAPSVFACSSSSDKTDRTLSLFTGKSGSEFVAGSIRAGGDVDVHLQEIYIPEWSVTKGFELNDGRSCANMIDHFTPPAFFKTVRGMEHEQLFAKFNVSAARNLSLSSEVRMCAEYNILEKRKWKSLSEEKNNLLQVKDKEIEELRSRLLQVKDESIEVAQLHTRVSSLEAIEGSLRGEVASAKEHNGLLEQEHSALKLKVTSEGPG